MAPSNSKNASDDSFEPAEQRAVPGSVPVPSHGNRPTTVAVAVDIHAARLAMVDAARDAVAVARETERLYRLLMEERTRYANLWAAVRAAVHAAEDGETDPMEYLRIEYADLLATADGRGGFTGSASGGVADRGTDRDGGRGWS